MEQEGFNRMKLLYIEACPRGRGQSRTLLLADAFLAAFQAAYPQADILRHDVAHMGLLPVDGPMLTRREALIDARAWADPLFAPARAFQAADGLLVAAPYWDLMFPAMLKTYIEHVFIRELTFRYERDMPIGLCTARRALCVTTAGSPIGSQDFGTAYLRATLAMLGIARFDGIAAEGLDIAGADPRALIARASEEAARLGGCFFG